MAKSKKFLFSKEDIKTSEICKSLAHPARVKILFLLKKNGEQTCQQIVDELPLSQSTVSQHLREMRFGGVLSSRNESTKVFYSVNKEKFIEIQLIFATIFEIQYNQINANNNKDMATQKVLTGKDISFIPPSNNIKVAKTVMPYEAEKEHIKEKIEKVVDKPKKNSQVNPSQTSLF